VILALRTGWTPDAIGGDGPGGISASFRRACHAFLYAERLTPILDEYVELASTTPSPRLSAQESAVFGAARNAAMNKAIEIREHLYPEDDDLG
jgi:hypothetical protein